MKGSVLGIDNSWWQENRRNYFLRLLRLFAASLKFYEHGQIVVCGSIVPDPLQTLEPAR
jgi:hypothetical protein